jgi:hypothetical protein
MAEFSKQWCELNDPDMPWDFDIIEVANDLKNNYYKPYICEGFGFISIMRDHEDKCLLAFDDYGEIIWDEYDQFINRTIELK